MKTLICLALLLAVPASASAAPPTVADAQRIAAAAFPGTCGPTLTITFTPSSTSDGLATGRQWVDGSWQTVACTITVRRGIPPERRCDVIVHERGHLAGIDEHTPNGIMSANAGGNSGGWPPCHSSREARAKKGAQRKPERPRKLQPGSRFDV